VVSQPVAWHTNLQVSCFILVEIMNTAPHFKLHSITPMATKVHVMLRSFVVLTWIRDIIELVTLWNNILKCNILMVWCGSLHLDFPGDVAYACTNIQQVA
jgi:hypothetical protein